MWRKVKKYSMLTQTVVVLFHFSGFEPDTPRKFIFLKSAKNNEFFSTNHDLFLEKEFPTLLRGFLDFLKS